MKYHHFFFLFSLFLFTNISSAKEIQEHNKNLTFFNNCLSNLKNSKNTKYKEYKKCFDFAENSILQNEFSETKELILFMGKYLDSINNYFRFTSKLTINNHRLYQEKLDFFSLKLTKYIFNKSLYKELNDRDLKYLIDIMFSLTFYNINDGNIDLLEKIYFECERKNILTDANKLELYESYIQNRDFDKARKIKFKKDIRREKLPICLNYKDNFNMVSKKYYNVIDNGKKIELKEIKNDFKIIGIVDPDCAGAIAALETIGSDIKILNIFKENSFLLLPQHTSLYSKRIYDWNQENPSLKIYLMHKAEKWHSDLFYYETPKFFFLQDNKIVHITKSSCGEKLKEDLKVGLKKIGLKIMK